MHIFSRHAPSFLRPVIIDLICKQSTCACVYSLPFLPIWARQKLSPYFNTAHFHPLSSNLDHRQFPSTPATEAIYHRHGTVRSFDHPRQHPGSRHRTKWHRHRHWHRFIFSFRHPGCPCPLPIPQRHLSHRPHGYQPLLRGLSCPQSGRADSALPYPWQHRFARYGHRVRHWHRDRHGVCLADGLPQEDGNERIEAGEGREEAGSQMVVRVRGTLGTDLHIVMPTPGHVHDLRSQF